MEPELIDFAKSIINRLRLSVDTNSALSNLAEWLCDYTKLDPDTMWSFKDHEMQIDIVNDTCSRQVVQKCSQVGLTNTSKRKALAITMISRAKHIIYVGPTSKWATRFAKTELHPTIQTSPILSDALNKDAKGTEVIGLSTSFIYLGGTTGATSGAISIPASYIFIDELDFCNQVNVGKYESRLKHAQMDANGTKGTISYFSTPTVEDFGVNLKFKMSDQKYYDVHCSSCSTWFTPDYFRDVVLPGFTDTVLNPKSAPGVYGKMIDLTPEEVSAGVYNVSAAYMRCPHCLEKGIDHDIYEDLCDPKRRKWIAKNPTSIVSGRQVFPWDIPKVNTIPSIIMQLTGYENKADFINFTLGLPYSDKNNAFSMAPFACGNYAKWLYEKPDDLLAGMCIGVDVGRSANITVGYKKRTGQLHTCYFERFRGSKDKLLGDRIIELAKAFKARSIVIDGMPDFSTAQMVAAKLPSRIVLACEYTKTKPSKILCNYTYDEERHLVSAYRTGVLTDLLKLHNDGNIIYPNRNASESIKREIDEVKLNLANTKKIHRKDSDGEKVEWFVKTGPDHYAHALSYLNVACDILGECQEMLIGIAAPINISSFKTQGVKVGKVVGAIT